MINNLFSIFDPTTSYFFKINWISIVTFIYFLPKQYFLPISRIDIIKTSIINSITKDLKSNLKKSYYKIFFILFFIFTSIFIINLTGLLPFIFTPTRHLSVSISLCTPLWIRLIIKGWAFSFTKIITHLLPLNTPIILGPFIVIIETIRNVIRPLTLSIRLTANIIAGHLLISLLRNSLTNIFYFIPISLSLNLLIILEIAVSIIQRYVFIILLSLYINEIN